MLSLGGCRVVFVTPTATTVSFIALTLTGGAATAGSAARGDASGTGEADCAGVVAWARDSGNGLAQAAALLDRVGGTAESDPGAVAILRDIARTLATLADDQRTATTPAATAKANVFIIAGLNGYSADVPRVAAGVEAADGSVVDAAVSGIAAANSSVPKGTAQLESAVGACGLSIATPAATR